MKKIISIILGSILLLVTVLMMFPTEKVFAFPGYYFWYPRNMHVRIYHPASEKYLGIDRNGNEIDGARLQLQRYEEGNQNQIFFLKAIEKDSEGHIIYQIRVHGESEMVIEIRNSSHEDYAEAAQWTTHNNDCAKWYFFTETDRNGLDSAICAIKNVESGKMLNVAGGNTYDGNNLIQYHEDGTSSEVFQIICVEDEIIGAMWSRDWSRDTDGMYWSFVDDNSENRDRYFTPINYYSNGNIVFPRASEDTAYLATVLWLDGNLGKKMLQLHHPPEDAWTQIKQALGGVAREQALDFLAGRIGLGAIPLGDTEGVISVIMAGQTEEQWYKIEEALRLHSKIRIEIYYKFRNGNWGVDYYTIVNDTVDTYWSGNKDAIGEWVYAGNSGKWRYGTVEYFYK